MNRSLLNVLKGGFGEAAVGPKKPVDDGPQKDHYPVQTDFVAEKLLNAKSVVIVPGYGMAVSQAQHSVSEITKTLRKRGTTVRFGIHPVSAAWDWNCVQCSLMCLA